MSEKILRTTLYKLGAPYLEPDDSFEGAGFTEYERIVAISEATYDALLKEAQLWRNSVAKYRELYGDALKRLEGK